MSETTVTPPQTFSLVTDGRWSADLRAQDRKFWVGLSVAVILHALLLVGISASKPRTIGDPSGASEAMSVDLVTEADLRSMSAVADQAPSSQAAAATPPAPQAAPQPPPEPATPETAEPEPAKAEPAKPEPAKPEPAKSEPAPVEAKPAEAPPADATKTAEAPAETPKDAPQFDPLAALKPAVPETADKVETKSEDKAETPAEKAAEKPAEKKPEAKAETAPQPKPKPPAQKPAKTARLDLSAPPPSVLAPAFNGSGAAGVERPPGITRSGENDAFARAVIKALQRTMPQLSNTFGRVTVRIVLTPGGDLGEVRVIKPSTVAGLDQNVVFATQQTSYPFPPANSKDVDRIFVVTYIYR